MKQSRIKAEYPYDEYYIYKVFHKKEKRWYASLFPIDSSKNKRTTLSYARYLMSVKEGRILNSDEEVDHIDNDRTNDSLDNLQILTPEENRHKEIERNGIDVWSFKCPNCGRIFERKKGSTHLSRGTKFNCTFCSRRCSGQFSANVQFGNIDINSYEIKKSIEENVIGVRKVYDADYVFNK